MMKTRLTPALVVFAVAFLVYLNTLQNGFVWDDHIVIENNPFLEEPSNFKKIVSPSFFTKVDPIEGGARPVFLLSLLADSAVWGKNPGGYHLTNVILHALNSIFVYWLALYIFSSGVWALIAGLLFAVHPVHTEAVNAVTFRADLLASLFVFLSLLCHIRFQRTAGWLLRTCLILISGCFYTLGLLSKEMAITLPGLALLFDILLTPHAPRSRPLTPCEAGPSPLTPHSSRFRVWVWRLAALGLYTVIAFSYMGWRAPRSGYHAITPNASQQAGETDLRDAVNASILPRALTPSRPSWDLIYEDNWINFLTMSGVLAEYFRLMAVPCPLQADRAPRLIKSLWTARLWLAWLVLLFLFWAAVRSKNKYPVITLGLAWCFITFLPVSNIIRIYNPVAERYLYLISAGACWLFAFLICEAAGRISARSLKVVWGLHPREVVAVALAGVILLPYGLLTIARNRDWKTDETLFSKDLKNARIHYNLGYIKQREGQIQEAILEYKRALAINPQYIEAMTNLGGILEDRGNIEEASKMYQEAVTLNPKSPLPYDRLGILLEKQDKRHEAIGAYRQALRTDDGFIPARMHLASSLVNAGHTSEAIKELKDVVRRNPSFADAHYNLGMIYDGLGDFSGAEAELKQVISLDPGHKDATMNLGVIYHHMGDMTLAVRWLKRAKALNPRSPAVFYNMGIVYSDMGRLEKAVKALENAVRLKPDYTDAKYNLAVTYQKMGRVQEAIKAYKQTLEIEPQRLEALNNLGGLYQMEGSLEQARLMLLRALEIDPYRPGAHNNLGNVYLEQGKIDKAAGEYLQALEYGRRYNEPLSNTAPVRTNLGVCHYKMGRINEAMSQWRAAIEAHPGYLNAYILMAGACKELGRLDEARALWRRVLEIDPDNSKALKELKQ